MLRKHTWLHLCRQLVVTEAGPWTRALYTPKSADLQTQHRSKKSHCEYQGGLWSFATCSGVLERSFICTRTAINMQHLLLMTSPALFDCCSAQFSTSTDVSILFTFVAHLLLLLCCVVQSWVLCSRAVSRGCSLESSEESAGEAVSASGGG